MAGVRLVCALAIYFDIANSADPIQQTEIEAVQREWATAVVNIGTKHKEGQSRDYLKALTDQFLDGFYAFNIAPTLLKPATSDASVTDVNASFCTTRDCAEQWFIGKTVETPGFALKPWTAIRFENAGVILQGDVAMVMGNCFLTDAAASETRIESSFGYIRDSSGKLRISLHHASSAVPVSGATAQASPAAVDAAATTTTTTAAPETTTVAAAVQESTTIVTTMAPPAETTTVAPTETTKPAEETATTTTTTTTDSPKVATDFNDVGRATKAAPEAGGGSFLSMFMKLIFLILVAVTLAITFCMSQVNTHPKMSTSERFVAGICLLQRKVEKLLGTKTGGNKGFLPSSHMSCDKDV